jgi:hypothetical protein
MTNITLDITLDITLKSNIIYNYSDNYIYQVIYHNTGNHITFIILRSTGSISLYKDNFDNLMNTKYNYPLKKYITLENLNRSMHRNIYQDGQMRDFLDHKNITINLEDTLEHIKIPMQMVDQQPSEIRLNSHFHDLYQDYLYLKNHECDFNFKKCILDILTFISLCLVYISVSIIFIGVFLGLIYIGQSI